MELHVSRRGWLLGLCGGVVGLFTGRLRAGAGPAPPRAPRPPAGPPYLGPVTTYTYYEGRLTSALPPPLCVTVCYDAYGRPPTAAPCPPTAYVYPDALSGARRAVRDARRQDLKPAAERRRRCRPRPVPGQGGA